MKEAEKKLIEQIKKSAIIKEGVEGRVLTIEFDFRREALEVENLLKQVITVKK